jgi:translation elongation factor EF-1beta
MNLENLKQAYQKVQPWLSNRLVQLVIAFGLGMLLCTFLYPSSTSVEKIKEQYQSEIQSLKEESSKKEETYQKQTTELREQNRVIVDAYEGKMSQLRTEIRDLKVKTKETYYKIVRPDGTIEEKRISESDTEESAKIMAEVQQEYKRQLQDAQSQWEKKSAEEITSIKVSYETKIEELKKEIAKKESETTVISNKKSFGVEFGLVTGKAYYGHVTYDIWGPVFIGGHVETLEDNGFRVGGGIGARF